MHVVGKCSSQRINVCRLWIRKRKALRAVIIFHADFTWCWSAIELQEYNTRSRFDTSDTSHLQKCSPNVACYFWSPCRTSYSSKKSFFFTFTLLHLTHICSSKIYLTPPRQSSNAPLPWEGDISKIRIPQNYTALRTDTTEKNMRKPQTALEFTRKFLNTANRLVL